MNGVFGSLACLKGFFDCWHVLIGFCFGRLKIDVVLKKKLRLKLLDYCTHGHASYDLFEHKKLYICEKENDFDVKLKSCLGCP